MKNSFKILVTIIFLSCSNYLFSQIIDTSKVLPDTTDLNSIKNIENLLENSLEETDDSKLLDNIDYLKSKPLDINTATREDLEEVPFMTAVIAKNIFDYRMKNGNFKSKRGLLKVDGISDEYYEKIKLFVVAKNSKTDFVKDESGNVSVESDFLRGKLFKNFDLKIRSRVQQDLQTRKGFDNGSYPGSKQKVYNRMTGLYNGKGFDIGANLTLEKDAGETSYTDFSSGYLDFSNWKFVKKLIVGDYILNFGQGLGLWSSLAFSKGSEAVDIIKKESYSINSYRSTNEVQFFRGAAANLVFNNYNFYFFYSNNFFDASIDTTFNEVSSIYFDGYHRTTSEQNRRNSGREQFMGGRVFADYGFLRLGATYWNSKFSKLVASDLGKQLYNFSGETANMISMDYDVVYKNFNFFGEFARSQSSNIAAVSALQYSFYKLADVIILYRNYPENFAPVHSFGFGEANGNTQNENGFYAGLTLRPLKGLTMNMYFDQFKFPYRTYFNPAPTSGNDFLFNSEYKLFSGFTVNFKYRNKNKEEARSYTDEFGRSVKIIDSRNQLNTRIGFDYEISKSLRVRSRYEYVMVTYDKLGGNNKGYLFFTDFRFKILKNLSASTRFIAFQTEDYDSRVYEFEEDLRGVMSNVGLYGKGTRWYFIATYSPFPLAQITAKYAATYQDGVKTIGSGNDLIQGDLNNRINIGIEINF